MMSIILTCLIEKKEKSTKFEYLYFDPCMMFIYIFMHLCSFVIDIDFSIYGIKQPEWKYHIKEVYTV